MRCGIDFKTWRIKERLELLDEACIQYTFDDSQKLIDMDDDIFLSDGQEAVLSFVRNPTTPVAMYEMSGNVIQKIVPLFCEFWQAHAKGEI